jgi:hypothetical protein
MVCRRRLFFTLVLITTAGCASAQVTKPSAPIAESPDSVAKASAAVAKPFDSGVKPFNPFGVPTKALLCHSLPRDQTWPHGFIVFEFEDGTLMVDDRLIRSVYDSLGNPRLLVITATEKLDGKPPIMHGFMATFTDDKPAAGFHVVNPSTGGGMAEPREALSPAMIAESRNLSEYLWSHRCERGPALSKPAEKSGG